MQGRLTREVRADNATDTLYTYDLTGRLKTVTDPEDQVTTYTYHVDDTLQQVAFTNANMATPTISYTYDTYYLRALTMTDAVGTTTYAYKAVGTDGALSLASVDGPLSSDTIVYSYDALGRVASRLLNGTGTELTYDALGRVEAIEFPIGTFEYTFDGRTARVATVTYGFRPGRGQHHALDALAVGILRKKVNWVLDADIRGFFDAIDHGW